MTVPLRSFTPTWTKLGKATPSASVTGYFKVLMQVLYLSFYWFFLHQAFLVVHLARLGHIKNFDTKSDIATLLASVSGYF